MENPLEGILAYLLSFGMLGLLVLFLVVLFIIWIIKKGVKQAIMEVLDDDGIFKDIEVSVEQGVINALCSNEFREQFRNDITYSIISANRQLENNERPSE